MTLYDPSRRAEVDPEEAIVVVHRFLKRARSWATDREIPRRIQRVSGGGDYLEAAKLAAWVAWRDFVDHAIQELEDGKLDEWFQEDQKR